MVAALPTKAKPYFAPDLEMPAHGVRVQPSGAKAYYVIQRDAFKAQKWVHLGSVAEFKTIEDSRAKARTVIARLKEGKPAFEPVPPKPATLAATMADWVKWRVDKRGVRTAAEIKRIIQKYILLPKWAGRTFTDIRRSDIAALLDHVEEHHGAFVADSVLTVLSSAASWVSSRDDTYQPPFVKGMRRVPAHKRKRTHKLDDNELRAIWKAAEGAGVYGGFIKLLLLSGQRRDVVLTMKWADIDANDVWHIPVQERAKGSGGDLKLPAAALEIIQAQPKFLNSEFVFAGRRGGLMGGISTKKAALDKASGVNAWRHHDLRRGARSLMSRSHVGVPREHAEKVLGHAIRGVEGVYDQHEYFEEKGIALAKLAAEIERIIDGEPGGNVVQFPAGVSS
jgi:integrase